MGIFTNIREKLSIRPRNEAQAVKLSTFANPYSDWKLWGGGYKRPTKNYKDVIFFQFVKLLGNMFSDVNIEYAGGGAYRDDFNLFKKWFDKDAFATWKTLCFEGVAVIAIVNDGFGRKFETLKLDEYRRDRDVIRVAKKGVEKFFVMTSDTFDCFQKSDFGFLWSYLQLAEKYLNNSDVAIDANGHILFVAPRAENGHTSTTLTPEQRDEWVSEMHRNTEFDDSFVHPYYSNRPLEVQDVNLTNFDTANFEKLIKVMLIIAGHFDVPASQVPLLDTSVSKGLSNGGEMVYGDTLKYKTFERILQMFTNDCAKYFNLEISYTINNNPNDIKELETLNQLSNENTRE